MQTEYDRDMWDISEPVLDNVRHVHLHLTITVGKLAQALEPRDHAAHHGEEAAKWEGDELSPIVADLVIHAAQLATAVGIDLGAAFTARYRENATRFAPDSRLASFGR